MKRGEIWWTSLPEPMGAMPGYRRPVLIIQANSFNHSRIQIVIAIALTSNLKLAQAPGNVLLTAKHTGLTKDSVANVSQMLSIDKHFFTELVGHLPNRQMQKVENGLRLILSL